MKRLEIKDQSIGKNSIFLNNQNIKSTVYFNPDIGYYIMVKSTRVNLTRIGKDKYKVI